MELLGYKVKDVITGYTGIASAYVSYITGCSQYGILGEMKEDKYPEIIYIDHQRLVKVSKKPIIVPSSDTGAESMQDKPR